MRGNQWIPIITLLFITIACGTGNFHKRKYTPGIYRTNKTHVRKNAHNVSKNKYSENRKIEKDDQSSQHSKKTVTRDNKAKPESSNSRALKKDLDISDPLPDGNTGNSGNSTYKQNSKDNKTHQIENKKPHKNHSKATPQNDNENIENKWRIWSLLYWLSGIINVPSIVLLFIGIFTGSFTVALVGIIGGSIAVAVIFISLLAMLTIQNEETKFTKSLIKGFLWIFMWFWGAIFIILTLILIGFAIPVLL